MELERVGFPADIAAVEIAPAGCDPTGAFSNGASVAARERKLVCCKAYTKEEDKVLLERAKHLIRERERLAVHFPKIDFCEPNWAILLDLFVAKIARNRVSTYSACVASGVPTTTALRHISALVEQGAIHRLADPKDGRCTNLMLSDAAVNAMRNYLAADLLNPH